MSELCFAELKYPVKDKLERFGLFAQLGKKVFFPTIGAADQVTDGLRELLVRHVRGPHPGSELKHLSDQNGLEFRSRPMRT